MRDAELGEGGPDQLEAGPPAAGPEHEVHGRRGDDGDEEAGDGAERRRRTEDATANARGADEPAPEPAHRRT